MSEIEKTCPSKLNFFCVMYSTILSTVSGFILVWSFGPTVFKIVEDPLSTLFANRQTDCNSFLSYEGSTADVNELFAPFSNFFYCLSEQFCNRLICLKQPKNNLSIHLFFWFIVDELRLQNCLHHIY